MTREAFKIDPAAFPGAKLLTKPEDEFRDCYTFLKGVRTRNGVEDLRFAHVTTHLWTEEALAVLIGRLQPALCAPIVAATIQVLKDAGVLPADYELKMPDPTQEEANGQDQQAS